MNFGEQVWEVHEALQACFPDVELEFEQVMLFAIGLSRHESMSGKHGSFVFTRRGNAVTRINNSGWKAARRRAAKRYAETIGAPCPQGFRSIRVHDLKRTFGRRLRAAGVSFKDMQDLLGHKSARITTQG